MKIRGTISNDFELDKYYSEHDSEQYLRGFNHQSGTCNANVCGAVTCKPYNSKST